ncbi:MAG: aminotransferase class III-fold pyridoxal phosphate-dependent enzyme [Cyclobacteriaceae bacterium]|nr:aminotransferase class III-fold pyridoxal phosphate-dependent enzyme [Cyclobacteriaceae bacterium]
MDISYNAARGDYLYANTKGSLKKVLDLTGGYGTNLLGHHNDELTNHAINYLNSGQIPLSDQLSIQKYPGLLSEKLNDVLSRHTGKSYYTLFGSTGSEVVEIAIHHAFLEWMKRIKKLEEVQTVRFSYGREVHFREVWIKNWLKIKSAHPVIIAHCSAFHGTSTGARSLMGDEERREKFRGLSNIKSVFIDDRDTDLEGTIQKRVAENQIELTVFTRIGDNIETCSYLLSGDYCRE